MITTQEAKELVLHALANGQAKLPEPVKLKQMTKTQLKMMDRISRGLTSRGTPRKVPYRPKDGNERYEIRNHLQRIRAAAFARAKRTVMHDLEQLREDNQTLTNKLDDLQTLLDVARTALERIAHPDTSLNRGDLENIAQQAYEETKP